MKWLRALLLLALLAWPGTAQEDENPETGIEDWFVEGDDNNSSSPSSSGTSIGFYGRSGEFLVQPPPIVGSNDTGPAFLRVKLGRIEEVDGNGKRVKGHAIQSFAGEAKAVLWNTGKHGVLEAQGAGRISAQSACAAASAAG